MSAVSSSLRWLSAFSRRSFDRSEPLPAGERPVARKGKFQDHDLPEPPGLQDRRRIDRRKPPSEPVGRRPRRLATARKQADARIDEPKELPRRGKHVVILVENLPVPFDRRPWQIAQTLKRQGFDVSVICPRMYEYTARHERLAGIDIYRYPNREGVTTLGYIVEYLNAMFWMIWHCLRLLLTRGVDAIHACNPPDLLFSVAWPFKVFFGVRFMFDHHDLGPEVYVAKFGRKDLLYRAMCLMERLTYRLSDVSLATNRSFKRIAMQRDGQRADRIFIVRNAPMPGRLVPGRARPELRFGRKHLVAYLGVMNRQDGLELLLESIAHVVHGHGRQDVCFALIGDGPEAPALKQRARELSLNGEVRFLGRISDGRAISDYLNAATLCVCPDPKNEMNDHSTMTKVVEYMALGKPIVAYDLSETIYSAADAAAYARDNDPRQFGNLIVELLEDEAQRQAMSLCGKSRFDVMLSWERSEEQLLAAYTRLFNPRCGLTPA